MHIPTEEIGNDASNTAFYLRAIQYLADLDNFTSVADINKQKVGWLFCYRSDYSDRRRNQSQYFYLCDSDNQIIAVVGEKTGVLPLDEGIRVIVNAKVAEIDGEKVLVYQSYEHQVLYVGKAAFAETDENEKGDTDDDTKFPEEENNQIYNRIRVPMRTRKPVWEIHLWCYSSESLWSWQLL